MPTTVNKDIGGGANDYSDPASWEADTDDDLVAADKIQVGRLYGSHTVTSLAIAGATVDSTRYRVLEAASGEGLSGSDPGRYDSAQGAALTSTSTYTAAVLYVQENFFRARGLQIATTIGTNQPYRTDNGTRAERCLFQGSSTSRSVVQSAGVAGAVFESCAIINRGASGAATVAMFLGGTLQNCTIATPSNLADPADAITISYPDGSAVIRNNVVVGYTNVGSIGTPSVCTNNYSDDASLPSGFSSITYTTSTGAGNAGFENITDGTHDFRIKSGSALDAAGTSTGAPTSDIYGVAFDSPPSVGAWELGATTAPLSGNAALSFATAGTIAGAGALAGSSALTFSPAGTLAGSGSLAGSAGLVFSATGALTNLGSGAMAGAGSMVFGSAANLSGAASIAGSAGLSFGAAASLAGTGSLAGASALVFSATGAMAGTGALSGVATLSFAPSGVLAGGGALAGASALVFAAGAELGGAGALAASGPIAFDATGTLSGAAPGEMSGVAALNFGAGASALTGSGLLAGIAALSFINFATLSDAAAAPAERPHGFEMGGEEKRQRRRNLVTIIRDVPPDGQAKITRASIAQRKFERAREEARELIAKVAERHAEKPHTQPERFAQVRTALKPLSKALGDWNWISVYQRMYSDAINEQLRQELAREDAIAAQALAQAQEDDERELMSLIMEWM